MDDNRSIHSVSSSRRGDDDIDRIIFDESAKQSYTAPTTSFFDGASGGGESLNLSYPSLNLHRTIRESYLDSESSWVTIQLETGNPTHGLDALPWNDALRPFVPLRCLQDMEPTEEEQVMGILSERMIAANSSFLEQCSDIKKFVLCKVVLMKKGLKNIDALQYHPYLEYIDLSKNELTDESILGNIPCLMFLDVSKNQLKTLLNFRPPKNMTYASYAYNRIDKIGDLSAFWPLVSLDISFNNISKIEGLSSLKYLRYLNLSCNRIKKLENLENLRLVLLNVESNMIDEALIKFESLKELTHLYMSKNQITNLRFLAGCYALTFVEIKENLISDVIEFNYFESLKNLKELNMELNPVCSCSNYVRACLRSAKNLDFLDNNSVNVAEKVAMDNIRDPTPSYKAAVQHANLMLLSQLNCGSLKSFTLAADQPYTPLIVLVGPLGGKKRDLIKMFCAKNKNLIRAGISHTTRPKLRGEVNETDYYFVNDEEFNTMAKNGNFLTFSEIISYSYGLSESELEDVDDPRAVIVRTDLAGALALRARGLHPHLVLALPRKRESHAELLSNMFEIMVSYRSGKCSWQIVYKNTKPTSYSTTTLQHLYLNVEHLAASASVSKHRLVSDVSMSSEDQVLQQADIDLSHSPVMKQSMEINKQDSAVSFNVLVERELAIMETRRKVSGETADLQKTKRLFLESLAVPLMSDVNSLVAPTKTCAEMSIIQDRNVPMENGNEINEKKAYEQDIKSASYLAGTVGGKKRMSWQADYSEEISGFGQVSAVDGEETEMPQNKEQKRRVSIDENVRTPGEGHSPSRRVGRLSVAFDSNVDRLKELQLGASEALMVAQRSVTFMSASNDDDPRSISHATLGLRESSLLLARISECLQQKVPSEDNSIWFCSLANLPEEDVELINAAVLKPFIERILKQREECLELHQNELGLFTTIVYTDEVPESLAKLDRIVRESYKFHPKMCPSMKMEKNDVFNAIVGHKLRMLNDELDGIVRVKRKQNTPINGEDLLGDLKKNRDWSLDFTHLPSVLVDLKR